MTQVLTGELLVLTTSTCTKKIEISAIRVESNHKTLHASSTCILVHSTDVENLKAYSVNSGQ